MAKYAWSKYLRRHPELQFISFFGEPVVLHCHHFNLFLQQTIEDPPYVDGEWILYRNAYETSYALLQNIQKELGFKKPAEALEAFADLARFLGFGNVEYEKVTREGGLVVLSPGHYTLGWLSKYKKSVKRMKGVEYFMRGYISASWNVAFEREPGSYAALEIESPLTGYGRVRIEVSQNPNPLKFRTSPGLGVWKRCRKSSFPIQESKNGFPFQDFAKKLTHIADSFSGDERGIIAGFNVYVTRHLANYYSGISYDFYTTIQKTKPEIVSVARALLEESGHVCVFHTFGNLLMNDDVQGLIGGFNDPEDYVYAGVAVSHALAFGDWSVVEFQPDRLLRIGTTCEYEGAYLAEAYPESKAPIFFLPGATAAIMNMVYEGKVYEKPALDSIMYNKIMKSQNIFKAVLETLVPHSGEYTRVRAERFS